MCVCMGGISKMEGACLSESEKSSLILVPGTAMRPAASPTKKDSSISTVAGVRS